MTLATKQRNWLKDTILIILLLAVGTAIFAPMMAKWRNDGDYTTHNQLAVDAATETAEFFRNVPHFLYHIATAIPYQLGLSADVAGALVMTLCYLALLLITYLVLRRYITGTWLQHAMIAGLAIVLALVAPLYFFTGDNLYLGYFTPHVYHNPTMIIMKPFSVALFFMGLRLYGKSDVLSGWWALPYALVTGLCLVAKPSFILAFVPMLGVFTGYFLLRQAIEEWRNRSTDDGIVQWAWRTWVNTPVNWTVLLLGIAIPSVAILYIQTITWTSSGGIGIDPFRVFFEWTLHYDQNADQQIAIKFLTSLAFPLSVYLLHSRDAWRDGMLNLAWLTMGLSTFYAYFLVDYTVIAAGDFVWSSQIAVLMLFITSTAYLLKRYAQSTPENLVTWIQIGIPTTLLVLHLGTGIHWYYRHIMQDLGTLLYGIW